MIAFRVHGEPAPQGSKRHVGNGRLVESSAKVRPWRQDVAAAALTAMGDRDPYAGPVKLSVAFRLRRPSGHYGTGRNREQVRPSAPDWPEVRPDLDKLARAVNDALTGICWRDDSQVVEIHARKSYAERAGADIRIERMEAA